MTASLEYKKCNYYRIGFYDNILNSDRLSMYVEIGYSKDAVITNISYQEYTTSVH